MNIKLSNGESVIKAWDYASSNAEKHSKSELIVTNKRVLSVQSSDISLNVSEVPVKSIKGVEGSFKRNGLLGPILKIILGVLLCLPIITIIIAIGMIRTGIDELKSASFELELMTEGCEGSSLTIGISNAVARKKGLFAGLFSKKIKINVNKVQAQEILEQIGALVIDQK